MDFNLDTTYSYNNDIHKSKIIKYKPNNLATMNTINTNINIILNREENHLNLYESYLDVEFVVSDDAGGVFANDANIRLHRTFKSSYRIYVFDTGYQRDHKGPQPIQLNFKFRAAVADVICHALVLTRKVISVNSDGNKMVDIVS